MNRNFIKLLLVAASSALLISACDKAKISGVVTDAPDSEIIVNLLDANKLQAVDTIKTDGRGRFSCKVDVAKGNPEFFYLNRAGVKIASVIVDAGDRVSVVADTLGNFEAKGTETVELHSQAEKDYRAFSNEMMDISDRIDANPDSLIILSKEMTQTYIQYYRSRVRFLMENSHSMAVIPVFYQKAGSLPVFAQDTDAIHFKNVCDSLETCYPDSRYVKALRAEADRRMSQLSIVTQLSNANPVGFPDIVLPDIKAEKQRLSEVQAKVVMLHFWTNAVPEQRRFNLEVLKPIYQKYYPKGLEIYQVALDADKSGWASTVKSQNLPWINVCDIAAGNSRVASLYNVTQIPTTFLISDGELVGTKVTDVQGLVNLLDSLLK